MIVFKYLPICCLVSLFLPSLCYSLLMTLHVHVLCINESFNEFSQVETRHSTFSPQSSQTTKIPLHPIHPCNSHPDLRAVGRTRS